MPTPATKPKRKPARRRKATAKTATPRSFTLRDLSRRTAAVVAACRKFGSVTISARDGGGLRLVDDRQTTDDGLPDWEARYAAMGLPRMNEADTELMARMIAGEHLD